MAGQIEEYMEPLIHSHITDILDTNHPLADCDIFCEHCSVMLHAYNNECMQTWVESGLGNMCFKCFAQCHGDEVLDGRLRLPAMQASFV